MPPTLRKNIVLTKTKEVFRQGFLSPFSIDDSSSVGFFHGMNFFSNVVFQYDITGHKNITIIHIRDLISGYVVGLL